MSCKNENQLNPTFGNVVFVHIEMTRYSAPFPVGLARDVEVNLITRLGARLPQEKVTINIDDSIDVEIDTVPSAGVYGIEVRGTYGGYAWRCFAPCCLNYTYPTEEVDNDATVTGDTYDLSMDVTMNAPNAAQDAAIEEHNENPSSHPYILGLIDDVNASLANYYTKSQTYSQSEVNNLIQSISQFTYEIVTKLPTASASTMNKIYLVNAPATPFYTEYITIEEGEYGGQYRWETIGDTSIALRDYLTAAETNTAINNALTNYYTKLETNLRLADKANVTEIAGYNTGSTIRVRGSNGVVIEGNNGVNGTNYSSVSATKTGVSIVGQSLKWNNADLATKAYAQTLTEGLVNNGSYNSTTHSIELKNGDTVLATIDATPFIKDGMVSSVTVSDGNLVITFNTDAGGESITLPISDIFDASDYYTKSEVYTKAETATQISNAMTNVAYVGGNEGTAPSVEFDPETDTVHVTAQTLSAAQQLQARTNIGAGTSSFSGSYNDLTNKPTIPDTTNFVQKSQTSGLLKNDGTVDTNTYLTSHQDISGKADKVVVVDASTLPSTLDPNKVYQMGTLTGSVTIPAFSAVASGDTEAKIWCFTFNTSTTAPTITWPAAITNWVGGSAPTINASKSYEVTVMDGIGAIMEA